MSFSMQTERQNKFSFLDIEVIREQGKFSTTINRKRTFSGVYCNFESFLPSVYKFGMVYTLVQRCFRICSDWTKVHAELTFLKKIFRKNGYPESCIDKCFKDPISKDLISGVVYKFQCGLCNESYYGESIRHLDIRSGEHIGVSPLTGKKVKPVNNSAVRDHLLHCKYLPSFDNFSILAHENKKNLLNRNRNISSAPLYLFHKVS